jgi:hypothetical protein
VFHGHGIVANEKRQNILRYFQKVNRSLGGMLKAEHAPLVLAGVEHLLPIYREANSYPHLMDQGITGNPEMLSVRELHEQAWAIVEPHFQKAQQEAVARYMDLIGSEQAAKDIREIVPAAHYGRVDTLFVALGLQQWGAFDPKKNTILLRQEAEAGDEDLLDLAAVQTLLHGGDVYAMQPAQMPDGVPLAAVFRY